MAAIPPDQTQPVAPEQAAEAATNGGRRRARPARPAPQPAPAPAADADPAAVPAQPLDPATLTKVLAGLGYANQGPTTVAHGDGEGGLIELVDSGVVRFPAPLPHKADGPAVYRLRPPLFGEHKRIRGALAEALGEVDQATIVYARATAEVNAAKGRARELDEPAKSEAMAAANRAQRAAEQAGDDAVEAIMEPWWRLVFDTLGIDGTPDEFGPWMLDRALAVDIVGHWRTSPRAPGR